MKTPFPFELDWFANFGPNTMTGKGLASPALKDMVDRFTIPLPSTMVKVLPKLGTVMFNNRIIFQTEPGKLLLFRRMEMSYGTHDTTIECKPQILFYAVGVENKTGQHFVRIFEDGTVKI